MRKVVNYVFRSTRYKGPGRKKYEKNTKKEMEHNLLWRNQLRSEGVEWNIHWFVQRTEISAFSKTNECRTVVTYYFIDTVVICYSSNSDKTVLAATQRK